MFLTGVLNRAVKFISDAELMNPANMLPAKLPAGVTRPVFFKRLQDWLQDLGVLQYIYTLVSTRNKFLFNTPFPECFYFYDKKQIKVYFLQFLIFQFQVLQACNSGLSEWITIWKKKKKNLPNLIMKEIPTLYCRCITACLPPTSTAQTATGCLFLVINVSHLSSEK